MVDRNEKIKEIIKKRIADNAVESSSTLLERPFPSDNKLEDKEVNIVTTQPVLVPVLNEKIKTKIKQYFSSEKE